jgi:hypothetical protein
VREASVPDKLMGVTATRGWQGWPRPFDKIYCQCDRASRELTALAILLTGDPNIFGYQLPPSVHLKC